MLLMFLLAIMPVLGQDASAAVKKPGTPTITSAEVSSNTVTLNWEKAKKARKYKLFVQTGDEGWKYLKSVKKNRANKKKYSDKLKYRLKKSGMKYRLFVNTNPYEKVITTAGRTYTYQGEYDTTYRFVLRAFNRKKAGKYSAVTVVTTESAPSSDTEPSTDKEEELAEAPGIVSNLTATCEWSESDSTYIITVTWGAATNASQYNVYRSINNAPYTLRRTITGYKYKTKATPGKTYKFKIIAENSDGKTGEPCYVSYTVPTEIPETEKDPTTSEDEKQPSEPESISLSYTRITSSTGTDICVNDTLRFKATILPASADKKVTWSISGNSGHITEEGVCTFDEVGVYTIRATASNGIYAESRINVVDEYNEWPVSSISLREYTFGETCPGEEDIEKPWINGKQTTNDIIHDNEYIVVMASTYPTSSTKLVHWDIENQIGAEIEVRGNRLVVKESVISKEQYRKTLTVRASIDDVEAKDTIKADLQTITISYAELLENKLDPMTARIFLWQDGAGTYADPIKETVDSVTKNCTTDRQKVGRIIEWFNQNISYVTTEGSVGNSLKACWVNKYGVCGDMSLLLAQMFRYANIPAGYYRLSVINHACTVFWLDGKWYTTDGTFYSKDRNIYRSGEEYMTLVSNGISCLDDGVSRLGFNITGGSLTSYLH